LKMSYDLEDKLKEAVLNGKELDFKAILSKL
jgi:8-oxo-dGTP diphosphatase